MCPFMKIFRHSINKCLEGIDCDAPKDTTVRITEAAREDLRIWAGFLCSEYKWLPIGHMYTEPPRVCREFVSDAAGLAMEADPRTRPGCGNVGFCEGGTIIFANQFLWPERFIMTAMDEKGVRFGDKTTTLEVIGMIMPFLLVPEKLANQHVRIMVDCFGTVFGMINRHAKGDRAASVFIRAIYLIAAYLNCTVHVQHLPRVSDWGALVTDRLSRMSTTTRQDRMLVNSFHNRPLPVSLSEWFDNPVCNFSLSVQLLEHVKSIHAMH